MPASCGDVQVCGVGVCLIKWCVGDAPYTSVDISIRRADVTCRLRGHHRCFGKGRQDVCESTDDTEATEKNDRT